MREGACIGAATLLQPWTLRLIGSPGVCLLMQDQSLWVWACRKRRRKKNSKKCRAREGRLKYGCPARGSNNWLRTIMQNNL